MDDIANGSVESDVKILKINDWDVLVDFHLDFNTILR